MSVPLCQFEMVSTPDGVPVVLAKRKALAPVAGPKSRPPPLAKVRLPTCSENPFKLRVPPLRLTVEPLAMRLLAPKLSVPAVTVVLPV